MDIKSTATENLPVILASVTALIAGLYVLLGKRRSNKLPPGPFNPFGFMYASTGTKSAAKILGLKKYGDVCCIHVLGTPCIYLNTHAKIREYFVSHADTMSGRLDMRNVNHRFTAGRGIVMNDGASWNAHRRFALSTLRDFGFGRGGTELIIQNELLRLVGVCASFQGESFDPHLVFNIATCNIISSLVFGEPCGNDSRFTALLGVIQNTLNLTNVNNDRTTNFLLKITTRLPKFFMKKFLDDLDKFMDYLEDKVEEHKMRFNGEVNDFIDGYLKLLLDENTKRDVPGADNFSFSELYVLMSDLFIAGMETTASTLRWAMLFLIRSPDVQKRVRQEIEQVIQRRCPTMADRKDMPYTDAVICEVQRFCTLAPLGAVHHRCSETVTIGQYEIPKDSLVFANIFAVHRDESVWPDAFNFNPLNFYDEIKNSLKNTEFLIPFGIGRRSCLGESLAKQELFILLVGLLQKFEVSTPDLASCPIPNNCNYGNVRGPPGFNVVFKLSEESLVN